MCEPKGEGRSEPRSEDVREPEIYKFSEPGSEDVSEPKVRLAMSPENNSSPRDSHCVHAALAAMMSTVTSTIAESPSMDIFH